MHIFYTSSLFLKREFLVYQEFLALRLLLLLVYAQGPMVNCVQYSKWAIIFHCISLCNMTWIKSHVISAYQIKSKFLRHHLDTFRQQQHQISKALCHFLLYIPYTQVLETTTIGQVNCKISLRGIFEVIMPWWITAVR